MTKVALCSKETWLALARASAAARCEVSPDSDKPSRSTRNQLPPASGTRPILLKAWMKLALRAAKKRDAKQADINARTQREYELAHDD